jgi:hypothetical protein
VLLHITSAYFRVFSLHGKMSRRTHRTTSCKWRNYLFGSSFRPDTNEEDVFTCFRIGQTHVIHAHCSMWTCDLFCTQCDVNVLDNLWITQMVITRIISSHTFTTVLPNDPFTTWIWHSHDVFRTNVGKSFSFQFPTCILNNILRHVNPLLGYSLLKHVSEVMTETSSPRQHIQKCFRYNG